MIQIKKVYGIIFIVAMLAMTMVCGTIVNAANAATEDAVSPGPAPDSGDGIPSGNQYIQPDTTGVGPAPNSGDGEPDGSGF